MSKIFFHVDVNSAFLSWSAIKHLRDGEDVDLRTIPAETLRHHFPNIVEHCGEMGYDVFKECIPVVPAQHYFMGGVWVDSDSKTSMEHLYAVGETSCNGVHLSLIHI